jgi:hypothetical protein
MTLYIYIPVLILVLAGVPAEAFAAILNRFLPR